MYKRFLVNFVNSAPKFYSKFSIQRAQYKFIGLQCNFSIQTSTLVTRGYNTSPHNSVIKNYGERYEQQLNELLQEPKYKTMYNKYKLEIEYWKNLYRVPDKLTPYNWLILLETATKGQRRKYLEFLWKIEKKEENNLKKRELKALQKNEEIRKDNGSPYGLNKVSMFYRIRDKTIVQFNNARLIRAMLHDPIVVYDLGYDKFMSPFERLNCAKQLLLSFSVNRVHDQPFNLYFCNTDKDTIVMEKLHYTIPSLYDEDFPLNITSKSYLDIFNKKQLVYLTPHAKETMTKYDPNLIYIIGALVDKVDPKPYSFQKAHREGIKMMKFPLSQNLDWGSGSGKNLPLNQVLSILLELRCNGNWEKAFTDIPKRKLREAREYRMEKLIVKRQQMLQYLERKE